MKEYPLDPNPYCLTSCDERGFHDVICSPPFVCPNFSQIFSFWRFLGNATGLAPVAFPVLAGLAGLAGRSVVAGFGLGAVGDGSGPGSFSLSLVAKGVVGSGRSSLLLPGCSASSSEVLGVTVMTMVASGLLENVRTLDVRSLERARAESSHLFVSLYIYRRSRGKYA
jgi:hypothetical protein